MTLDSQIASDVQEFDLGEFIELYELDLSSLGGGTTRITSHTYSASPISFNGNAYTPINCKAEGFEFTSKNQLPRPTFTVSVVGDTGNALRTLIRNYDDLIGIPFTRRRTFSQYLGGIGQPELPQDVYSIERKVQQNNLFVKWELSAFMDHEGKKIPARLVLRDNCTHVYRIYSGGSFDYSKATCPYTGANYYDINGDVVTDPADDKCGKKLTDCKLRFPSDPLPTRQFPGVSRTRIK
ncbi:MAG: phage minor tail protein L [Halobacteriota archaeon]|nr:phage minor tail protein L [Halobacteriota archaeon]